MIPPERPVLGYLGGKPRASGDDPDDAAHLDGPDM